MNGNKDFFDNMNPNLGRLYNLTKEDIDEKDLYPIQNELKSLGYRFISERSVGEGAMKKILSVKDLPSGRRVAKAGLIDSSDKKNIEAFLREARLTASLQHPNIIRIYDIGMDKNEPWFSMELIEGQSLQEKIEYHRFTKEEWPLFQRLDLFYKVCDAVAYAHSKNILHLDIKPDNIRLGLYGEVILCDWGLGYYIYDDEDDIDYLETPHLKNENTLHGYIRGTPGFLAPERIKGGKSVSSDVFSLGALLFILLTYEIPFIAEDLDGILNRTLRGNLTEPKVKIPVSIKSIYSKALKVNEQDRYRDVQSIQEDIDKYRNGFATVAEEAGFFKQLFLFCNRNKVMCGLVAAFALILSMVIYSYIEDIKQSQKRYRAEKEKAEEALALHKQGEREKQIINKDFTEFLVSTTKLNNDHFDMDKGLMIINLAVDKDPENLEAWLRKGYIHFIRHEFEQAYKALEKSQDHSEDVQQLKKMSQENFGNEGLLSPEETVSVMSRLPEKFKAMMMYFVAYDSKQRQSLTDHSIVVKNMLEYRNGSSDFRFHYDESKRSLSLANNPSLTILDDMPLESLKSFCILKTLKLRTLNLSNTAVSNLEHLRGLEELEELNLEKTLVLDLRPLTVLKSLKKVILSTNLRRLTKGQWPFQIVYSDKSGNNSVIEQQISRILKRFDDLDKDQSQTLSVNELSVLVPKESVMYFSKVLGIDTNGDQETSRDELVVILTAKSDSKTVLIPIVNFFIKNFDKIDTDKNGEISLEELLSSRLSGGVSVLPIMRKLDKDKNGSLSLREIERIMQK